MAVYKVAQDVEAEDKLLGPFTFRQFVYLIIVAIAGVLAWGLSRIFIGLAIIPLPVILFFGALALPLRKDQPMEIYLGAIMSFYLKPRRRLWAPDGIEQLVEITAPKVVEVQRTKDLTQSEAERRLSYLADIADTGGWAVRHAAAPQAGSAMLSDVFNEAVATEDVLDTNSSVAQSFDAMISQADARYRQTLVDRMHQPAAATPAVPPTPTADPYTAPQSPTVAPPVDATGIAPTFNPYPNSMHQSVVLPMSEQPVAPPPQVAPPAATPDNTPSSTSETTVSPDIIKLASNTDLSIETIQREADRIRKKDKDDGEVFISLR